MRMKAIITHMVIIKVSRTRYVEGTTNGNVNEEEKPRRC